MLSHKMLRSIQLSRRTISSNFKPSLALPVLRSFSTATPVHATKKAVSTDSDDLVKPKKARAAPKKAKAEPKTPKAKAAPKKKVEKKAKAAPKKPKKAVAPKKVRPTRVKLPKRIGNAWILYMEEQIPAFKAALPEGEKFSVSKASQEIATNYRQLSQNEKDDLATRLEAVKAQYKRDLDIAVANLSPEQIKSENLARAARRQSGKSKKKNLIDPLKPKKPLSAFFIYLDEKRGDAAWLEQTKSDALSATDAVTPVSKNGNALNSNLVEFTAVAKRAAEEWRAMGEAEKQPYHDLAKEGLASYKEAVEAYAREKQA